MRESKKRMPQNKPKSKPLPELSQVQLNRRGKQYEYAAMLFLIAVGFVYSLHFLQHFVFPNPDFTTFVDTGRTWLSFKIPGMKRAPVFSIIAFLIAKVFNAPLGSLFGTGLFNAIMLPLAMVLIYLVGRKFLGKAAVWLALLAGLTPWMVRMSSQPIAEMTLVVLCVATALTASTGTRWAYLFAMLGSLARWDLAGLIPAVALVDILRRRKWLQTIFLGAACSVPFIISMVITYLQLKGKSGGVHYMQVMSEDGTFELVADLKLYASNICSFINAPLFKLSLIDGSIKNHSINPVITNVSSVILAVAFIAGAVLAVIKKQWALITMLIAGIPYVIVHAMYPYRMPRYCLPFAWAGLLLSAYAMSSFWRWFKNKPKPPFIIPMIHLAGALLFSIWAVTLLKSLKVAELYCPVIMRLVVIAAVLIVAGFIVLQLIQRKRTSTAWLVAPAFLVVAVFSNAVTTSFTMGDGQQGANFKVLAEWFLENAEENDQMISTMPGYVALYAKMTRERFPHTGWIKPEQAEDFEGFVNECRRRGITLIAWDSRLTRQVNDRYYKEWGLDRLEYLGAPFGGYTGKQIGQCRLIHLIRDGSPKIAVYRIMPEVADAPSR